MIHEDERRTLEGWPEAKIITAKTDCELGGHYHKVKTEKFILTQGSGYVYLNGYPSELYRGDMLTIEPGVLHSFKLKAGSVLIGLCSHPFDPTDDYR